MMQRKLVFFMICWLCAAVSPAISQTQLIFPQIAYSNNYDVFSLRTTLTLPAGFDQNNLSLRLFALGSELLGVVADPLSDRYRNPAFVTQVSARELYLDLGRTMSAGSRFIFGHFNSAQAYSWGFMASSQYRRNQTASEQIPEPLASELTERVIEQDATDHPLEVHAWLGKKLSSRLALALDYTFGQHQERSSNSSTGFYDRTFSSPDLLEFNETEQRDSLEYATNLFLKAHSARLGLLWRISNDWQLDLMTRVELSRDDIDYNKQELYFSSDYYERYTAYNPYRTKDLNRTETDAALDRSVDGNDYRLALNLKKTPGNGLYWHYLLTLSYLDYTATEMKNKNNSELRTLDTQGIQHETRTRLSFQSGGDGAGETLAGELGFGASLQSGRWLVAGAIRSKMHRGNFDYRETGAGFWQRNYHEIRADAIIHYDSTSAAVIAAKANTDYWGSEVYLPVGAEVALNQQLFLRLGARLAFLHQDRSVQMNSSQKLNQTASRFDTRYRFGAGYLYKTKLAVDFYTDANITHPETWRLALCYYF